MNGVRNIEKAKIMDNPKKVTALDMPLKLEQRAFPLWRGEAEIHERDCSKTREIFDRLNFVPNLLTELKDDLENKPMENWGKWLGKRTILDVHELEMYIWQFEWEYFCADIDKNTDNTDKPINVEHNIYAQVNLEIFDDQPRLVFTFFTPNPNHKK